LALGVLVSVTLLPLPSATTAVNVLAGRLVSASVKWKTVWLNAWPSVSCGSANLLTVVRSPPEP